MAASAMSAKCELNIGKILPYETYHAARKSRPRIASIAARTSTANTAIAVVKLDMPIGHEIAHGVFHFEGKFWRTLTMLLFKPRNLTRRYVLGERAGFMSPIALSLICVF
jgi:hypothetical protein